jgi:hypothetical protein
MSIQRKTIERVKQDMQRLLDRIAVMERAAGWTRYTAERNEATNTQHPDDAFNYGQYTAAVKRASMDLSKSLVEIRR